MKINGVVISEVCVEKIFIPRPNGDIVLMAKAVLDYDEFEKLLPEPKPPTVTPRGKAPFEDPTDPDYRKARNEYFYKRFKWVILQSLKATPGLEFETVKENDPETWGKMDEEFKKAGFAPAEIGRIYAGVTAANGLSTDKIEEARKRFTDTATLKE